MITLFLWPLNETDINNIKTSTTVKYNRNGETSKCNLANIAGVKTLNEKNDEAKM